MGVKGRISFAFAKSTLKQNDPVLTILVHGSNFRITIQVIHASLLPPLGGKILYKVGYTGSSHPKGLPSFGLALYERVRAFVIIVF